MKRHTTLVLALVATTTLALTAGAYAKRGDGDHGERMIERATERLELDANQVDALQALQLEMMETRELMRGEEGSLKDSLAGLIAADSFDQGEALSLINERIAALQANTPELVAAAGLFLDGLDAEQRAQVQDFVEHSGGRHGKRRHRGGDEAAEGNVNEGQ